MLEKTGTALERLCGVCGALFCAVILIQNLQTVLTGQPILALACAAAAGCALFLCVKYLPVFRGFSLALFLFRFALAVFFILWLRSQPVQDFKTMYDAAVQLAQGNHTYLDSVYFYNWAYQSAFVAYEALVIRLLGPSLLPLQLLNALYMALTNVLVYRIGCRLLPQRAAMGAAVLYAIYPGPLFLAGVLTNQHLSVLLLYCAVYVLVSGKLTLGRGLCAGALIALGNAMRPIGVILLLAGLLWILCGALRRCKEENLLPALLPGLGLAVGYFALGAVLSGLIVVSGINPQGLTNNQPMWKFVLGLNQDSRGCWNQADYDAYLSLPAQEADRAMREAVKERLQAGPVRLARLAWRKSAVMWGANEDLFWGFGHLDENAGALGPLTWGRLERLLLWCDKGVYLLAFGLAMAGLLLRLREKEGKTLLPVILLCGYYAVHLIVEVQSRYRYFLMPCVALLAGITLEWLIKRNKNMQTL